MDIDMKVGEEKLVTLTYTDDDDDPVDVSGATFTFAAKRDLDDSSAVFTKENADFDVSNASSGIVTFWTDDTDVTEAMTLVGEGIATFSATSKDKTAYITMWFKKAVA